MKKIFLIIAIASAAGFSSCTKKQFADTYADPAKVSSTTLENQYAGFLAANLGYSMYQYWNYFVVLQNTMLPWTQVDGYVNTPGRYIPGAAAISAKWSNYYAFLAQYKEFLRLYNALSPDDQAAKKIYYITATIYYYDQTEKMVDIFGSIPWSDAGLLGTNGGNYAKSEPKYDDAATIYTTMLDNLKGFSDDLNSITVSPAVNTIINTQDFINHGNITKWEKYCNSLRLRMLTRVSGVSSFKARVNSEIAAIVGNPSSYPLVLTNADNILINVKDVNTSVNNGSTTGGANASFHQGLIGWGGADEAGKVMIDFMNTNVDPRLRSMFEAGANAMPAGTFIGLDPSLDNTTGKALADGGTIARYNRSTLSQNIMIPGMIINAAEVNFLLSEYYLNAGNDGSAKSTYEAGITQSIQYYYYLRTISNDQTDTLSLIAPTNGEINAYIASNGVAWVNASTDAQKLNRIAIQKWINFNVMQPDEAWAEVRRLKLPALTFVPDNGIQPLPPNRWLYPTDEQTYNNANYQAVAASDKLTTKIFWDVK